MEMRPIVLHVLLSILATTTFGARLPGGFHNRPVFKTNGPYHISHRGANGEFPESTTGAYKRAIQEGTDFLETDIGATKDGFLICFHDVILDAITDVANHTAFADRKTTYIVEGKPVTGFFVVDFTLDEIKTLKVHQRFDFRDQSHNGVYDILTFEEYLSIALGAPRVVGVHVEIKGPVFINQHVKWSGGKIFEDMIVDVLKKYGYKGKYMSKNWLEKPIFIQTFAPSSILRIANQTDSPKILNIGPPNVLTQDTNQLYLEIMSDKYLDFISPYIVGISPSKEVIAPLDSSTGKLQLPITDIVERAHARGLQVHPATFRNEPQYIPLDFLSDSYREFDFWVKKQGVDAVMTDFPATLSAFLRSKDGPWDQL